MLNSEIEKVLVEGTVKEACFGTAKIFMEIINGTVFLRLKPLKWKNFSDLCIFTLMV